MGQINILILDLIHDYALWSLIHNVWKWNKYVAVNPETGYITNLKNTGNRFTKVLVKYFWMGLIKLPKEPLPLLCGDLGVQVDAT